MAPPLNAAVVLGGGAPNAGLMAGALAAVYDNGKTFNTFLTSGAGASIALVYLGARGTSPSEGLQQMLHVGIDDAIYSWVPLGYKTFFKRGPFTVPLKRLADRFKVDPTTGDPQLRRFYNDFVDLAAAVITPTNLTPLSDSLCAHFPFVEESIDFDKVHKFKGEFVMNAYCIEDARLEQFAKNQIGPEHFYAALSYPFIYPPTRIGDLHYFEGAAHDPLNLPRFHRQCVKSTISSLVVVDLLGAYQKALIRRPRNLLDAYGISILISVVAMARKDMARFEAFHKQLKREAKNGTRRRHIYDLERLTFSIPEHDYPTLCDWSRSNMERLWAIGYDAGTRFVARFGHNLPDHAPGSPDPM